MARRFGRLAHRIIRPELLIFAESRASALEIQSIQKMEAVLERGCRRVGLNGRRLRGGGFLRRFGSFLSLAGLRGGKTQANHDRNRETRINTKPPRAQWPMSLQGILDLEKWLRRAQVCTLRLSYIYIRITPNASGCLRGVVLQIIQDKFRDARIELNESAGIADSVAAPRKDHQLIGIVPRINQRVQELDRVREVNVVVACAVDKHQLAFQLRGLIDGRG